MSAPQSHLPDAIRPDGRETLAGVLPDNGAATRNGGTADGGAVGGAGDDAGRNGNAHPEAGEGAAIDTGAGADDGVGIGAGEVYSPAAREPERLNARNYRITAEDRLGAGSLKQKARDNFAAIELVAEARRGRPGGNG